MKLFAFALLLCVVLVVRASIGQCVSETVEDITEVFEDASDSFHSEQDPQDPVESEASAQPIERKVEKEQEPHMVQPDDMFQAPSEASPGMLPINKEYIQFFEHSDSTSSEQEQQESVGSDALDQSTEKKVGNAKIVEVAPAMERSALQPLMVQSVGMGQFLQGPPEAPPGMFTVIRNCIRSYWTGLVERVVHMTFRGNNVRANRRANYNGVF